MINALQFTDLAVGGFEAAVEGFVHRRQEQAASDALEGAHEARARALAKAWHDYAKGLERRNAQLAGSLAQLQQDYRKAQSRRQSIQDTFERYTVVLTQRIRELDEKLQQVSATRFALNCARASERQRLCPEDVTEERIAADEQAYKANIVWFMAHQNVRLGVPDVPMPMPRTK